MSFVDNDSGVIAQHFLRRYVREGDLEAFLAENFAEGTYSCEVSNELKNKPYAVFTFLCAQKMEYPEPVWKLTLPRRITSVSGRHQAI